MTPGDSCHSLDQRVVRGPGFAAERSAQVAALPGHGAPMREVMPAQPHRHRPSRWQKSFSDMHLACTVSQAADSTTKISQQITTIICGQRRPNWPGFRIAGRSRK